MYIIALLNPKGGVGKTTLAVNLAYSLKLDDYRVLVADADPQGSSRDWSSESDGEILPVLGFDRKTIANDIESVKSSYDYVIIDSSSQLNQMLTQIISISDMLVIPVTPSPYDVWAIKDLLEIIDQRQKIANKPAACLLINRYIHNAKFTKTIKTDIEDILEDYDIKVFDTMIPQRQIYPQSTSTGVSVFHTGHQLAIEEINNVKSEIKRYQNGLAY